MTTEREIEREALENSMMGLRRSLEEIELIKLRMRQAERRSNLRELLGPAIEQIEEVRRNVKRAEKILNGIWQEDWRQAGQEKEMVSARTETSTEEV